MNTKEAILSHYNNSKGDSCLRYSALLNSQKDRTIYGYSSAQFGDMSYNYLGKKPGGMEKVLENRQHFLAVLGINLDDIVAMQPVHKTNIVYVGSDEKGRGARDFVSAIPGTDGLITDQTGIALSLNAADCSPIVFLSTNPKKNVLALAHAGREGTILEISRVMVQKLKGDFDIDPEELIVYIGPTISRYPLKFLDIGDVNFWLDHVFVPASQQDLPRVEFKNEQIGTDQKPKYRLSATLNGESIDVNPDLTSATIAQLVAAGVPKSQIEASFLDTYANALEKRIFSHNVSLSQPNSEFPDARFMAVAQLIA